MAWIKVVRKLGEYSRPKDTEVEIEFCWGNKATIDNTGKARVFINALREGLKKKDLSKIASAFNVPYSHVEEDMLSQFTGLLRILWNFDTLRKAKWSGLSLLKEKRKNMDKEIKKMEEEVKLVEEGLKHIEINKWNIDSIDRIAIEARIRQFGNFLIDKINKDILTARSCLKFLGFNCNNKDCKVYFCPLNSCYKRIEKENE